MEIQENFSLKEYNTFHIEATCKYFVRCEREEDLLEFVKDYELKPEEVLILGGGSNFLFTEDFDGVIFYPVMQGYEIVDENEREVLVRVGSGVVWDDFVAWAVERGYGGIENLSLVPGHVGATPVQNIGAYGMEVGESIVQVEAVDIVKAEKVRIDAATCRFSYRDSIFKHEWKNRYVVTHVTYRLMKQPVFRLQYGSVREEVTRSGEITLKAIREAIIRIREAKLPDVNVLPNAGSFFKNPLVERGTADALLAEHPGMPVYPVDDEHVKLAAGWLIEVAGWKGKGVGNAAVHDKQALVLVNKGGASGIEIAHLANEIKKSVFLKFGVWLEPEVNII